MHCKDCPIYEQCDNYHDCVYPVYVLGLKAAKQIFHKTKCDVSGCMSKASKKNKVTTRINNRQINKNVNLCQEHHDQLYGQKAYSIGCIVDKNESTNSR